MKRLLIRRALVLAVTLLLVAPPSVRASDAETRFDFRVRGTDLYDVLDLLGMQAHMNVVADISVPHVKVSLDLHDVTFRSALDTIEGAYTLTDRRNGNVIVVSAVPAGSAATTISVELSTQGRPAQPFVQMLQLAIPGLAASALPESDTLVVTGSPKQVDRAREIVANLSTPIGTTSLHVIPLRYLKASDVLKALHDANDIAPTVSLVADDTRGVLIFRGSEVAFERINRDVTLLDTPPLQVTYAVQVLDVQPNNDTSNVGVLFNGLDSTGKPTSNGSTFYAFANKFIPINATISALVAKGEATVLARPKVTVANAKTGQLVVGTTYPIVVVNGSLTGGTQVQFIQVGVQLQVTPAIGADGSIATDLQTTYSEIIGNEPVSQYPIVGTRTVNSNVRVSDGQSIIIGGLFSDVTSSTVSKVPVLGDIPVLGGVFRNRQTSHQKDEIVFVITPQIGASTETGNISADSR